MENERAGALGRPRGFDVDQALDRAVLVFWAQGYEGASLDDLTKAMGITRNSMYRAYGNKEELFRKALDRYTTNVAQYVVHALEEPTARDVALAFLDGALRSSTRTGCPAGCLGVQGALATGDNGLPARETLAAWRESGVTHLRQRFERAVEDGDLSRDDDPGVLARYLMTVANGISVQAAGGTTRDELRAIADMAMRSWPRGSTSA